MNWGRPLSVAFEDEDGNCKNYPDITLRLRPPVVLENDGRFIENDGRLYEDRRELLLNLAEVVMKQLLHFIVKCNSPIALEDEEEKYVDLHDIPLTQHIPEVFENEGRIKLNPLLFYYTIEESFCCV
ncbi:hypothetical protein CDAR_316941 [Caerostris darwini]|uniref:Uncharacterized protein n=1 Tax=Caerostris darwini TaxID=1538125 RepID=A0AAV4Q3T8_9ARAC|nr:hypothetical protein CDAR_316941 [Caerostris darwini]